MRAGMVQGTLPGLEPGSHVLRFELTAQFLDSEAQSLAELLPLLTRAELARVVGGRDLPGFRMARLADALRALRVALHEAGFSSR